MKIKHVVLLGVFLLLYSCGYGFVGSYSSPVGGLKSIYVENVKNFTSQPNLQSYLREDLIEALKLSPGVRVAYNKGNADGILSVGIVKYSVEPSSFNAQGLASSYRCLISAQFSLRSLKYGDYIVKNRVLSAFVDFNANSELSALEKAKSLAITTVLRNLADKIKNDIYVNF